MWFEHGLILSLSVRLCLKLSLLLFREEHLLIREELLESARRHVALAELEEALLRRCGILDP